MCATSPVAGLLGLTCLPFSAEGLDISWRYGYISSSPATSALFFEWSGNRQRVGERIGRSVIDLL